MKNCLLVVMLSLLPGISWGQCSTGTPGTNCSGPLSVQPQTGNNTQSAITLVDLGPPALAPAAGQYTLSIASGMLVESNNGNNYHSLVGPQGPQGATGPTGPQGTTGAVGAVGSQGTVGPIGPVGAVGPAAPAEVQGPAGPQGPPGTTAAPSDYSFYYGTGDKAGVGTAEVGGSFDRDQIDMFNATSVRLVVTIGPSALPSGSYAQAEYTPDGTNWFALSGEVPLTTPNGSTQVAGKARRPERTAITWYALWY
jgi:Collagen triple helix repeat (20 copies)